MKDTDRRGTRGKGQGAGDKEHERRDKQGTREAGTKDKGERTKRRDKGTGPGTLQGATVRK